jgi:hypothetical protein
MHQKGFFREVLAIEAQEKIVICHETHRGRVTDWKYYVLLNKSSQASLQLLCKSLRPQIFLTLFPIFRSCTTPGSRVTYALNSLSSNSQQISRLLLLTSSLPLLTSHNHTHAPLTYFFTSLAHFSIMHT